MQPGKLLLRTAGACDFDPEHLLEVFGEQRQRFIMILRIWSRRLGGPDPVHRLVSARGRPPPVRYQHESRCHQAG